MMFIIVDYSNSFAVGIAFTITLILFSSSFSDPIIILQKFFLWFFLVIVLLYLLLFFIWPFFTPLIATSGARLASFDSHYAMTVLPGFDFVCCNEFGVVERSNYGLSMFLLTAMVHKIAVTLGVQDPTLVLSVRVYQVTTALLLVFAIYLLNRKHFILISAVALAITPSLNTFGEAVYHPNQAGIRYIPFLAGIIVMALESRRRVPRTFLLSTISALLFIANLETGFAVFSGFLVFLILSKYDPNHPYSTIIKELLLFFTSVILIFFITFELFAKGLYRNSSTDLFSFVELFASGYGGLVSKPSVFATIVAFFAVTAVIRGVLRARSAFFARGRGVFPG